MVAVAANPTLNAQTGEQQRPNRVVIRFINTVTMETSLSRDMPMTTTGPDWLPTGARFSLAPPAQLVRDAQAFIRAAAVLGGTTEDDEIVHAYVMSRKKRVEPKPLTRKAVR